MSNRQNTYLTVELVAARYQVQPHFVRCWLRLGKLHNFGHCEPPQIATAELDNFERNNARDIAYAKLKSAQLRLEL